MSVAVRKSVNKEPFLSSCGILPPNGPVFDILFALVLAFANERFLRCFDSGSR